MDILYSIWSKSSLGYANAALEAEGPSSYSGIVVLTINTGFKIQVLPSTVTRRYLQELMQSPDKT
jgi:hypothetical protein